MPHAACAALASLVLTGLLLWINRRVWGCLPDDPPTQPRKQHDRPIPLAGIAVAVASVAWVAASELRTLTGPLILAAVTGFVDDRGKEHGDGLDWRIKGALLGAASLLGAATFVDPGAAPVDWLLAAGLAFVLCNATNFLDNMDGVAGSLSAVALLALGGWNGPFAAIGWAAIGFLPWNWPRPRAFLGDCGAYHLGLAAGLAAAAQARTAPRELLAVAVPLADFAQVIAARLWLGLPPWVGDRRHLSHILHHRGLPRWAVAPVLAVVAAGLAALR